MPQYNVQALFNKCLSTKSNPLNKELEKSIKLIVDFGERQKGVLTVVITGLVYKYYHPEQDVRQHQATLRDGYSGRTFDAKFITPFLRNNHFPSMAESGWLTRSLEQKVPYDMSYTGSIAGKGLKDAFLKIYDSTQTESVLDLLSVLFKELVRKRDISQIALSTPANLTVSETLGLLERHFNYQYKNLSGQSRLPSIAIYSAYKGIIDAGHGRYLGKTLCNLDSHTASDKSTGAIGDIQINTDTGYPFEGIEIKAKSIDSSMLDIAYEKIQGFGTVERYYILSTFENIPDKELSVIREKVNAIRSKHGCEVIVNGVLTTLKYFLRLTDSQLFISNYTKLLEIDDAIKYEHKEAWNKLCSSL